MDIDKKIDELIIKNIKKDYVSLKIKVDYNFNLFLIYFSLTMIIYSLLILLKPKNLNIGFYTIILYIIPILILKIFNDFKNNYLKYSSELSKIIFIIIGIFISLNVFIFISLIIFKCLSRKIIENYPHTFLFFLPIYSIIIILLLFSVFLKKGFHKINKTLTHNLILFNLIIIFVLVFLINLKINLLENKFKVKWIHIIILILFYHSANFFGYSYIIKKENTHKNPLIEDKSFLLILNFLLNFSLIGFYLILGLILDNSIKINNIILFVIFWFFFLIMIFKGIYKNKKIKNFLQWRNVLIE
jgi:hypothetical protein